MLTASPVSVQIIACETPLAIVRASAEPRSAIESKTSSMPLTVPIRPSSGDQRHQHAQQRQVGGHRRVEARDHRRADLARAPGLVLAARPPRRQRVARLARQDAREVPGALDHERPHHEAADEDADHERPALVDEVRDRGERPEERSRGPSQAPWAPLALEALGQQAGALLVENLHDLAARARRARR